MSCAIAVGFERRKRGTRSVFGIHADSASMVVVPASEQILVLIGIKRFIHGDGQNVLHTVFVVHRKVVGIAIGKSVARRSNQIGVILHGFPCVEPLPRHLEIKGSPIKMVPVRDRKSTRLNSSHANISYAVFCLKKKKKTHTLNLR